MSMTSSTMSDREYVRFTEALSILEKRFPDVTGAEFEMWGESFTEQLQLYGAEFLRAELEAFDPKEGAPENNPSGRFLTYRQARGRLKALGVRKAVARTTIKNHVDTDRLLAMNPACGVLTPEYLEKNEDGVSLAHALFFEQEVEQLIKNEFPHLLARSGAVAAPAEMGGKAEHKPSPPSRQDAARGGKVAKWNAALQEAIDRIGRDLCDNGRRLTLGNFKSHFRGKYYDKSPLSFTPLIPNCDELYIEKTKLAWTTKDQSGGSIKLVSLTPYFVRAKKFIAEHSS